MKPEATNQYILEKFKKALAVMEVENANPFRIRAYQNAMAAIQGLGQELSTINKRGNLDDIPAIGQDLANKIKEILDTGTAKEWEKLYKHVPAGMFALLDIPSIGPKRAFTLAEAFSLSNQETAIEELRTAAKAGKVQELEGFGEKLENEILENLDRPKPKTSRMRLDEGALIADQVIALLEKIPEVDRVDALGSLRRYEETVGDVDIGVATKDPDAVTKALSTYKDEIVSFEASGSNMIRLLLPGNRQADIKFQTTDKYGATLQHFTGSKFHNIALREFALTQGKSLSEHGIKYEGKMQTFIDEESFYKSLGLDYIPPELRQNNGEIQAAQKHTLPKLVTLKDIKGDYHNHTNFDWISSHDYGGLITELYDTAHSLGYSWLAIGDHNPSQTAYSESELIEIVKKRNEYIDKSYQQWHSETGKKLKILKTLEVDILPNGSLPLPNQAVEMLDFVVISIHSRMNLASKQQTDRIISALNHPKVKIIGHPTGRLIGERQGMQIDWETLFAACLDRHVALEVNAHPIRLDLPDELAKQAIKSGLKLSIGTDAHAANHLNLMKYGVAVARRAWAQNHDIINTYTHTQIMDWIHN